MISSTDSRSLNGKSSNMIIISVSLASRWSNCKINCQIVVHPEQWHCDSCAIRLLCTQQARPLLRTRRSIPPSSLPSLLPHWEDIWSLTRPALCTTPPLFSASPYILSTTPHVGIHLEARVVQLLSAWATDLCRIRSGLHLNILIGVLVIVWRF